jgi:RNA polymerase sigma-70 factor (ECF subfamily)
MLAKERIAIVHEVLEGLSARQRGVFVMRFIDDMEITEIAEVTDMRVTTVKTHLQRAISVIRARIR